MHEEKRITNASIALNGESQREIRLRARHCSLFVREWRERREREREREGGEETREERSRERGRPSSAARSSSDCDCVAHLIDSFIDSFIHSSIRTNERRGRTDGWWACGRDVVAPWTVCVLGGGSRGGVRRRSWVDGAVRGDGGVLRHEVGRRRRARWRARWRARLRLRLRLTMVARACR